MYLSNGTTPGDAVWLRKDGAAAADVAAMPGGPHDILEPTREAVERRACTLLARLQMEDWPRIAVAAK